MATLIKTLKLQLGTGPTAEQFECQLNRAEVTDEPSTEEVTTFCGTEVFATSSYKLNLEGFQDWTDVEGLCEIIHGAYRSDPVAALAWEVSLGEGATIQYRSGSGGDSGENGAKPTSDVPFGGTAGSPLAFTQVLDIVGVPDETALA